MTIKFARELPAELITNWQRDLPAKPSTVQEDAVEYLGAASAKWEWYQARQRTVTSLQALQARVQRSAQAELQGVLLASAPWHKKGELLGFCAFRRTWCSNVVFDYLGVRPSMLEQGKAISGLGTALLYSVARVAVAVEAPYVWAETTDSSAAFYAKVLRLSKVSDVLRVKTHLFYERLESGLASS